MGSDTVERARAAADAGAWRECRSLLEAARREAPVRARDLELLARATWWLGDTAGARDVGERAYRAYLAERGEGPEAVQGAARVGLELALSWTLDGDLAVGRAWSSRVRRILRDEEDGPLHGYLRYLEASTALEMGGDPRPAVRAAQDLHALAARFDDRALEAMALVLSGLVALWTGDTEEGFASLDEAMLGVLSGSLAPLWAGDVHCTVIHLCHELGDLARMRDWTDTMNRWSAALSETFLYAAVTRVHQLQLSVVEGRWDVVEAEVGGLSSGLVGAHGWVAGEGYRSLGDVRLLRGDLTGARAAYDRAEDLLVSPQPGAALLAEAQGRPAEALAGLRAAIGESSPVERARLLLPTVEVALRAGDRDLARTAAADLAALAERHGTPGLRAWSAHAAACLQLDHGDVRSALPLLDEAAAVYRSQHASHATARVHELVARARDATGEPGLAAADRATAAAIYERLGAAADLARLAPRRPPGGLTDREVEVLRRVAAGASNREVARALVISEKTVSRHLANLYAKAGVSSRTAAAAWAREHGIDGAGAGSAPNTPPGAGRDARSAR